MKTALHTRILTLVLAAVFLLTAAPAAFASSKPEIAAKSGIVIDYETGDVLYSKNPDTLRAPASMTKIMTAYIIFEELESGRLTLDTMIPISDNAAAISVDLTYPSSVPLTAGTEIRAETLLKLILLPSASASCIAMAEYISGSEEAFVVRMNETAVRLGLTAEFKNCHGARPHNTTARSIAMLVREFIHRFPQILDYTSLTSVEFDGQTWKSTNHLLGKYFYEGCDGFKTGTTREAGFCLAATAERSGRRIISVIMGSTDNPHRYSDTTSLLDYGFASLQNESRYFRDIAHSWARPQIERLAKSAIALHDRNGFYRPNDAVTRSEFTVMLLSALEPRDMLKNTVAPDAQTVFTDLDNCWAKFEISHAVALGLINGFNDSTFRPEASITREEAMTILDRALALPDAETVVCPDVKNIHDWALPSVSRVVAQGYFKGNENGLLNPRGNLKRSEAAAVICNLIDAA